MLAVFNQKNGFLLSLQINMEAVTSTDYDSTNLSRNFNQVGFNTYNYSQFEEKYKPRQSIKYGEDYQDHGRTAVRNPVSSRTSSRHAQEQNVHKSERSHSQPERQHQSSFEARSKSQDSRELTFYQIDPPLKHENRHGKSHRPSIDKTHNKAKELTFYDIDGPGNFTEKPKDPKQPNGGSEKPEKKEKSNATAGSKHAHGKSTHQEQKTNVSFANQANRLQPDALENSNRQQCNILVDPPKYRQYDRPPRYQEDPPKSEPPPKYHPDPPKYSEVTTKRQDESKRIQVCEPFILP